MKSDPNQIRRDTKQFYEDVGDKFSQTRKHWWFGFEFMDNHVKGHEKILDFGCGNGRLIEYLKYTGKFSEESLTPKYHGVDISDRLINHAKAKYPGYSFETINKESSLRFKDNSFDLIFSIAVFHHFNPVMAQQALRELRRVLKSDGSIIITVWYLWNQKYFPYLWKNIKKGNLSLEGRIPFNNQEGVFWRYCYWWTLRKIKRLVKASGFGILEAGVTKDRGGSARNLYIVAEKRKEHV